MEVSQYVLFPIPHNVLQEYYWTFISYDSITAHLEEFKEDQAVQGQAEWGFVQPDLKKDTPSACGDRGYGLDCL